MPAPDRHLLVVGASGVIGAGAVEHFARTGWRVTALSRRPPIVGADCAFEHLGVDLADERTCAAAVAAMPPVTHLVYAAVSEAPGLVTGWRDQALIDANGRMFANILDPLATAGALRHVCLLQGTKAYGAHRHPVEVPCREDCPRDDHPNFYWLHEDHARRRAAEHGFGFTIFRPQVLFGAAPGAAMNPVAAIGAYAALTRELGRPFACPGDSHALMEVVDTGLIAEAFDWAMAAPAARDRTFNLTNGDVLVLSHAWPHLAAVLGLAADGEAPASLAAFFAEAETQAAWARLVAQHGLRIADLPALLGESHHYLDLLVGARIAAKSVPVLLSTIRIRQAGFPACRDSLGSLVHWLGRMIELKLLPPMGDLS
jgi:nucleoside-diphosphate-sugar epimerase